MVRRHDRGDRVRVERTGFGRRGLRRPGGNGRDVRRSGGAGRLAGPARERLVDAHHSNASLDLVQNVENPTGGDFDPVRTIVGFVIDLVERLRQE